MRILIAGLPIMQIFTQKFAIDFSASAAKDALEWLQTEIRW